jgi:WS/DGAT/MGAT family acyltransferase
VDLDRLSPDDLLELAASRHAAVPMQLGALLTFDPHQAPSCDALARTLAVRCTELPRLTCHLHRTGPGAGPPVWLPDPCFDVARHVDVEQVGERAVAPDGHPGRALLDRLADLVLEPLPLDRPPWRMVVLSRDDRAVGLVVVLHHVLADGVGGLALLAALAEPQGDAAALAGQPQHPPRLPPSPALHWSEAAVDAWRRRAAGVRAMPETLRRTRAGLHELGAHRLRLAGRTSLLAPTGPRRRVDLVDLALPDARRAATARGATVTELVLVAVAAALHHVLAARGDLLPELVISVPVSARPGPGPEQGNAVGVVPVRVPVHATPEARLAAVQAQLSVMRAGRRGSSAAVLAPGFRLLARAGAVQWFVRHQRLVHTFATSVRGPAGPLVDAGGRVARVVPLAVNPGNVTVSFDVLSACGRLVVAVVSDPSVVPEHHQLRQVLEEELTSLCAEPREKASAHG